MGMTVIQPKESQKLWESILYNSDKDTIMLGEIELPKFWIEKSYDAIMTNRAKSRGTIMHIETDDSDSVIQIKYEAVKILPQEILKPRFKDMDYQKRKVKLDLDE